MAWVSKPPAVTALLCGWDGEELWGPAAFLGKISPVWFCTTLTLRQGLESVLVLILLWVRRLAGHRYKIFIKKKSTIIVTLGQTR